MQSKTGGDRTSLTEAEVVALIEAEALVVDYGVELLDSNDDVIEDISDDVVGGVVRWDIFSAIHSTATFEIERDINWYNQRLKPYVTLNDGTTSARFDLGVFLPTTPQRVSGEPVLVSVDCYDKLVILNNPIGRLFIGRSGAKVLKVVRDLIEEAGEDNISLDQSFADIELPFDLVWLTDNKNTHLSIINYLLRLIGYRELWVDEAGIYHAEPHELLDDRTVEWTYSTTSPTTTVVDDGSEKKDFFNIPNKFIFINDDIRLDVPSIENGLYVVVNEADGQTSIASRGRTISRIYRIKAANQTALRLQGDRIVELEQMELNTVLLNVGVNPLHQHYDVVALTEDALDIDNNYVVKSWNLVLGNADMSLELIR